MIRNVIPESLTGNAVREIAALVGAGLADNSTWYGGAPRLEGIVPMHHAQSLWGPTPVPEPLRAVLSELGLNLIGVVPVA